MDHGVSLPETAGSFKSILGNKIPTKSPVSDPRRTEIPNHLYLQDLSHPMNEFIYLIFPALKNLEKIDILKRIKEHYFQCKFKTIRKRLLLASAFVTFFLVWLRSGDKKIWS